MSLKINDLPQKMRDAMPRAAQFICVDAILSAGVDVKEPSAESIAHDALKARGWHEKDGKWERVTGTSVTIADERITVEDGEIRIADSTGYLIATPRVARTGIQLYLGDELGKPSMKVVRVWRPEEEVFDEESMKTYAHRPVTNNHPPALVDSTNWRKYAVGQTGDSVLRDKEFVRVPIVLMDESVIKDFRAGKKQLSQGYTMDLLWGSGRTPAGEEYDAIQRQIRINHTAVVTAARGGPELSIGDTATKKERPMKTIVIDGMSFSIEDRDADFIQRHLSTLDSKIVTLTADVASAKADGQKQVAELTTQLKTATDANATKDAEIATLKKAVEDGKLTPAKIDELVRDRAVCTAKAKAILGDKLVVDGKTVTEIQAQVVNAKLGDAAKGWTEAQIAASFNTMTADVKVDTAVTTDSLALTLSRGTNGADGREKSYQAYDNDLTNAWKSTPATRQ